jgi:hypothetical protein
MADQAIDEKVNEEVKDQTQEVAEATQDEAQEETQEEVQNEEEQEEQQLEDEPEQTQQQANEQPSSRETLRIQSLLKKYGPPQERTAPQNQVDYKSMIDADDAVYEELDQASQRFGNQQYQEGLKQANAITFNTRLEVDAPKVASKYTQLDKDSDDFNPAVASSLNEMYLSAVGYNPQDGSVTNPNLRYADYIDAMFELVEETASRKVQQSTRNITKQAANTGLRPDGSSAERLDLSKPPEAMTDKELDAYIAKQGFAPKKR